MDNRFLEPWFVGTATMVLTAVTLLLGSYLTGAFQTVVIEAGTVPVSLLFGYLWLLTLVAAGSIDLRLETAAVGQAALVGGLLALVYLTVVFVVGFVAPVPDPLDPATVSLGRAVAVGTAGGGLMGGLFAVFFGLVRRGGEYFTDSPG